LGEHHSAADAGDLRPGTPIGPYDLLMPIGTGGMAEVWAARTRSNGQIVALKVLLPEVAENEQFQQMFFDEACIASRVRHPNVCETYELAHENGSLYLAMEWVDGPSLMRLLRPHGEEEGDSPRVPIDMRTAARIVADACAGLHAAHNLRGPDSRLLEVVHRDVSPHNLLLGSDGSVKVTDFGVAKALGKSHMTLAGQVKGKLAYMSPEQLVGGGLDRRSDVFALGVVLYEITTGQKPFVGEHDTQVMAAIVMGNYLAPSAIVPGYPPDLEAIVVHALASETHERFQSAQDMQRALDGWLVTSGPPLLQGHVAILVRERCGEEVAARARAVHEAMRLLRMPGANDAGATGRRELTQRSEAQGRAVMPIVAAALIGAVLGVGVLGWVWSNKKKPQVVSTQAVASAASAANAANAASAALSETEPPPAAAGALGRVRVKVDPPTSVFIVDGVLLPRDVDRIARPEDGGTLQILVRADGHEDTILVLDEGTPDEVEVVLLPVTPQHRSRPRVRDARGADAGGRAGTAEARAAASAAASSVAPEEAPPNPYE
jgi:serine/threonine-protein kinase